MSPVLKVSGFFNNITDITEKTIEYLYFVSQFLMLVVLKTVITS